MQRWSRFAVLVAVLSLAVATLGQAQGLERELTITMGEFFFQASGQQPNEPITLDTAVPYRITFRNVGSAVHRVKFGRGLIVEEGVPFAYTENLFTNVPLRIEGVDSNDSAFRVNTNQLIELDLEPKGEIAIVFTLPVGSQGTWELGCFVIGHYEAGMRTDLIVR